MIDVEDKKLLERQSRETLAKWWCELNRWGWPGKLPDPEFEKAPANRQLTIMRWIEKRIGKNACLKEWNKP